MPGMTPLTSSQSRHHEHPSKRSLEVRCVVGAAVVPELDGIAQLRATVLKAWPELHDGDAAEERSRLQCFDESWRSVAVLVLDAGQLVGASLGLPLEDTHGAMRKAFASVHRDASTTFLMAGCVLLPGYRGRGLGHRFFDERETHTRSIGTFEATAFATVERDPGDPRRPPFGRSNEPLWRRRGYLRDEALTAALSSSTAENGDHPVGYAAWMRPLERAF